MLPYLSRSVEHLVIFVGSEDHVTIFLNELAGGFGLVADDATE